MALAPEVLVVSVSLAVLVVPVPVVVEVVAVSVMEIVAAIVTVSIGAHVVLVVRHGMAATTVQDVAVTVVVRVVDAAEVLGSELVVPARGNKTVDHELTTTRRSTRGIQCRRPMPMISTSRRNRLHSPTPGETGTTRSTPDRCRIPKFSHRARRRQVPRSNRSSSRNNRQPPSYRQRNLSSSSRSRNSPNRRPLPPSLLRWFRLR